MSKLDRTHQGNRKISTSLFFATIIIISFFGPTPAVLSQVNHSLFGTLYLNNPKIITLPTFYQGTRMMWATEYSRDPLAPDSRSTVLSTIDQYPFATEVNIGVYNGLLLNIDQDKNYYTYVDFLNSNLPEGFGLTSSDNFPIPPISVNPDGVDITLAANAFWAGQYCVASNKELFGWKGLDKDGVYSLDIFLLPNSSAMLPLYDLSGAFFYYNKKRIFLRTDLQKPFVGLDVVAHELAHGILDQANWILLEGESKELNEGFAQAMELFTKNKWKKEESQSLVWTLLEDYYSSPQLFIDNPKLTDQPNTLWGEKYLSYTEEDYHHVNSSVLMYLINVLCNGVVDKHVDDDQSKPAYTIVPIASDAYNAQELVMKMLFKAFTDNDKMPKQGCTYVQAKRQSLRAISELGYPEGTPPWESVWTAWELVGVHDDYPDGPPTWNSQSVERSATSRYNGLVKFLAEQFTENSDPQSPKLYRLQSKQTSDLPPITTKDTYHFKPINFVDANNNSIYDLDDDWLRSEYGVSVHKATQNSFEYFASVLGQKGIDEIGSGTVTNILGDNVLPVYDEANSIFYYQYSLNPQSKPKISLDWVGNRISQEVRKHYMQKYFGTTVPLNAEAAAINQSLGYIFGVAIKNKWRAEQQPQQMPVWTFGEDVFDGGLQNFEDYCFYNGINYDQGGDPTINAHLLNHVFFLLGEGGAGYLNDDPAAMDPYDVYPLNGYNLQESHRMAEKLFFELLKQLGPSDGFLEARDLSIHIADQLWGNEPNIAYLKACIMEAYFAVGIGESAESAADYWPNDHTENADMWPTTIVWTVKYQGVEMDWHVQISERSDFPAGKTFEGSASMFFQNGKQRARINVNLDGNVIYYWRIKVVSVSAFNAGAPTIKKNVWRKTRQFTTKPYKVELVSPHPKAGLELQQRSDPWALDFEWGPFENETLDGTVKYHVTIEPQPPSLPLSYIDEEVSATSSGQQTKAYDLQVNYPYEWSVQAIGPKYAIDLTRDAIGVPSDIVYFYTNQPQGKMLSPADGSKQPPYGIPVEAEETKGASGYLFEVSNQKNGNFKALNLGSTTASDIINTQLAQFGPVKEGNTYYCRVTPIGPDLPIVPPNPYPDQLGHKQLGLRSEPVSFVIDFSLAKVALKNPVNKGYVPMASWNQTQVIFMWKPVLGMTTYKHRLYKGNQLIKETIDAFPPATLNGEQLVGFWCDASLAASDPAAEYFWDVTTQPQDPNLPDITSDKWSYKIDPDDPIGIFPAETDMFHIHVDPNTYALDLNSIQQDVSVNSAVTWQSNNAPAGYKFYFYKITDPYQFQYGQPLFDGQPVPFQSATATSFLPGTLEYSTPYRWSVSAINHDGSETFAMEYYFKTEAAPAPVGPKFKIDVELNYSFDTEDLYMEYYPGNGDQFWIDKNGQDVPSNYILTLNGSNWKNSDKLTLSSETPFSGDYIIWLGRNDDYQYYYPYPSPTFKITITVDGQIVGGQQGTIDEQTWHGGVTFIYTKP